MFLRAIGFAFAVLILTVSDGARSQDLGAVGSRIIAAPVSVPNLSVDCRSRRLPGDMFRRPLRRLSRAVRANRPIKVLAIGSSSTVGVGASSPSATYLARIWRRRWREPSRNSTSTFWAAAFQARSRKAPLTA